MKFASEAKQIMKNELKTEFASGAKRTIPGCDYWGIFDGYDVYRCYSKTAPQGYPNVIFAIGNWLYMNGEVAGYVSDKGEVSRWRPKVVLEESNDVVVASVDADSVIAASWKRTVEDLVNM